MNSESKDKGLRFRVKPGEPVPMFAPEICLTLHLRQKAMEARGAQEGKPHSSESAEVLYWTARECAIHIGQTTQEVEYGTQGQGSDASEPEKSEAGPT